MDRGHPEAETIRRGGRPTPKRFRELAARNFVETVR